MSTTLVNIFFPIRRDFVFAPINRSQRTHWFIWRLLTSARIPFFRTAVTETEGERSETGLMRWDNYRMPSLNKLLLSLDQLRRTHKGKLPSVVVLLTWVFFFARPLNFLVAAAYPQKVTKFREANCFPMKVCNRRGFYWVFYSSFSRHDNGFLVLQRYFINVWSTE